MASRPRHPNKEIEAAVKYAEQHGWIFIHSNAHAFGHLRCPAGQRQGCQTPIWSTPRNTFTHARKIRRDVDLCRCRPDLPEGL